MYETILLSEVARCGASQKNPPWDSTISTAQGGVFGMCRRLRLITTKSLFVLACLKTHNLILCKETPSTTLEVFLGKTCIVYAVELLY